MSQFARVMRAVALLAFGAAGLCLATPGTPVLNAAVFAGVALAGAVTAGIAARRAGHRDAADTDREGADR